MPKCVNCGYDVDSPLDLKKITHSMNTYYNPITGKVFGTLNSEEDVVKVKGKEYVTAGELDKRKAAKVIVVKTDAPKTDGGLTLS